MTLEYALLQTVRHGDVRNATVEGEHAPMGAEPVPTFHVLGRPGKQQLAEAQARHKHARLVDLTGLQIHPLDWISGVINFNTFSWIEIACSDRGFPVLRKLAVKLLPEV